MKRIYVALMERLLPLILRIFGSPDE